MAKIESFKKWVKKYPKGNPEKPGEVSKVIPGVGRVKPGQEKYFKNVVERICKEHKPLLDRLEELEESEKEPNI